MDDRRLDLLVKALTAASPRRFLLGLFAALPFLGGLRALAEDDVSFDCRRKRRKQRHRKRKNPGNRKRGCTRKSKAKICANVCGTVKNKKTCGKTVVCGPACAEGQVCQGGVCGVACSSDFCPAASEICIDGACQACDVTCTAANHVCDGAALQTAIAAGGTVLVCAGRYTGTFSVAGAAELTLFGAGMGSDPATATIARCPGRRINAACWGACQDRAPGRAPHRRGGLRQRRSTCGKRHAHRCAAQRVRGQRHVVLAGRGCACRVSPRSATP